LLDRDGRFDEVLDLVLSAPEDASRPEWQVLAGDAAMRLSDEETAQGLDQAALASDPGNSAASSGLARIGARRRDYETVLDLLDGDETGVAPEGLNQIGLRISAHRRLGRTADAARAASVGLHRLLANDQLHDAARLLDRLGFHRAGEHLRDRIRRMEGQPGRTARNRMATHLLVDGRPSEALTEYRAIGGRNWQKRISGRNRERLLKAWQGLGGHRQMPDWDELERMRVRLPDDAFTRLLRRGRQQASQGWDEKRVLLVTGTLGSGGAERQVVLTARGLQNAGTTPGWPRLATLQDLSTGGNAHLLPDLRAADVTVHDLAGGPQLWRSAMPAGLAHTDDLASLLPGNQAI